MKISTILLVLAVTLCAPGYSQAEKIRTLDDSPETRLILLLSQIHQGPSAEQLEALQEETGIDIESTLMEVAADQEESSFIRGRAINTLKGYPSAEVRELAAALISQELEGDLFLLGRALDLAQISATSHPEWTLEQLSLLVSHDDHVIRERVVLGLGELRMVESLRPLADELLLQVVLAERNPTVKDALDQVFAVEPELQPAHRDAIQRR